jgi:hypothetical protein
VTAAQFVAGIVALVLVPLLLDVLVTWRAAR